MLCKKFSMNVSRSKSFKKFSYYYLALFEKTDSNVWGVGLFDIIQYIDIWNKKFALEH